MAARTTTSTRKSPTKAVAAKEPESEEFSSKTEGPGETDLDLGDEAEGFGAPMGDEDEDVEVGEEFQFTSDTGNNRAMERMAIKIDGEKFWLYRPSNALIYMLAGTLAAGSDLTERLNAMVQLIQVSMDDAGWMYVRRRMADRRNNFDDELLGNLVSTILNKWATPDVVDGFNKNQKTAQGNRAARRQASRAKSK